MPADGTLAVISPWWFRQTPLAASNQDTPHSYPSEAEKFPELALSRCEPRSHQHGRHEAGRPFQMGGTGGAARAPSKSSLSRDVDVDLDISRTCSATRRLFLDMDFESIVPDKSRRWRIGNEALVSFLGRYAQNTMCRFHDRLKHCNLANPTRSEKSDLTRLSGKRACLRMGCAVNVPNEARADTADVGGGC
jgi:hypothetical protein